MSASESPAHLELKRLALVWAQANGYPVVGCEVSLPSLRLRLDVAAYRPGTRKAGGKSHPAVGVTAVFECKATRADLLRDCRLTAGLMKRIKQLTERRLTLERLLRMHYPSLRHGDGLWPEYESFDFDQVGHVSYRKVVTDQTRLSRQLHGQTKFESLMKWQAANLHYLVVEPGLIETHEIPMGWGVLVRDGQRLNLSVLPHWREVEESLRLSFLHRVAVAGTRATNRLAGVDFAAVEQERRGLPPRSPESPAVDPAPYMETEQWIQVRPVGE